MSANKRVAALGGEGIGPEVVDVTCEILAGAGMPVDIVKPPHGEPAIKSHGNPVPDETRKICEAADGVLFGAAGAPPTSAVVQWARSRTSPARCPSSRTGWDAASASMAKDSSR